MSTRKLVSTSGREYQITLPEPTDNLPRSYIFAFAKSGSTLLDNMISTYCQLVGLPSFSLFNAAFDQGVATNEIEADARNCILNEGVVYTGYRHFPKFDIDLTNINTILLTRDPRDMLVSMYFSIVKSHAIPEGNTSFAQNRVAAMQMDINTFVLQKASGYLSQLLRYQKMLEPSNLKVFRYEDVIYEKEAWFLSVLTHLGLTISPLFVKDVVNRFDIIPEVENENEHIRQVHPGNYKNKLSQETISKLNEILAPFLAYFNYEN